MSRTISYCSEIKREYKLKLEKIVVGYGPKKILFFNLRLYTRSSLVCQNVTFSDCMHGVDLLVHSSETGFRF